MRPRVPLGARVPRRLRVALELRGFRVLLEALDLVDMANGDFFAEPQLGPAL